MRRRLGAVDTNDLASARERPARNVVLFIGDGMGAGHRTFFRVALNGHTGRLAMDALPVAGVQHTDPPTASSRPPGCADPYGVGSLTGSRSL